MKPENRLTNEEIKARLILIVGIALSFSFVMAIVSLIYGLLFVVLLVKPSGLFGSEGVQVGVARR